MSRGRRVNRADWPVEGPHRQLLELFDRVHADNGIRPSQDVAQRMHLAARSRVHELLRGTRLPTDEKQTRRLVEALGGSREDADDAAQLYEMARRAQAEDQPKSPPETAAAPWRLDPAFRRHWEPRSRGVERAARRGWYFTGRTAALSDLVAWVDAAPTALGHRAMVVTGDPGSGKSAVLARLVVLTDETYRAEVPPEALREAALGTIAAVGSIDIAVHAAGKTTTDVMNSLGAALGLAATASVEDLIDFVLTNPRPMVVVVDALDEAMNPREVVADLLIPLIRTGAESGIRFVVGSRRELLPVLRAATKVIDLDLPQYFSTEDVRDYIVSCLLAAGDPEAPTPYRDRPDLAQTVGEHAAAKAGNSFLIAQLVALDLNQREEVIDPFADEAFPSSVADAMERYLISAGHAIHRRGILAASPEACSMWVRDLLRPLAYVQGDGLTDDLTWATLATRLGAGHYEAQDVRRMREQSPASALLKAIGQDTRPAWALFHQALAEFLRQDDEHLSRAASDVHQQFTETLLRRIRSDDRSHLDWVRADAYTRANLPRHAAMSGRLDELMRDPGFLLTVNPDRLVPLLVDLVDPNALSIAHAYERASHGMREASDVSNATMLHVTARLFDLDAFAEEVRATRPIAWTVNWCLWRRPGRHRTLPQSDVAVHGVTCGELAGLPIAITANADGTIGVWDLADRTALGDRLAGHTGATQCVAFAMIDEVPVAVSGGADGLLNVWDLATWAAAGPPIAAHAKQVNGIALGFHAETPMILSGGADGCVRAWDLATRSLVGEIADSHEGEVVAVALGHLGGQAVAITAGADRFIRLWDVTSGFALLDERREHTGTVNAVALSRVADDWVLVSGATDGTLRLWHLPLTKPAAPLLMPGHQGWVNAIAVGSVAGESVAVSVSNDRSVRVWSLANGLPIGGPRTGHRTKITGVAIAEVYGRATAVTTSRDRTVRLWDLTVPEPLETQDPAGHSGGVNAVAVGRHNGVEVVVSVSNDRTLRRWDLITGERVGKVLTAGSGLRAVAVRDSYIVTGGSDGAVHSWDLGKGELAWSREAAHKGKVNAAELVALDGDLIVVTVGDDRALRLWNLASGAPAGEIIGHKGGLNDLAVIDVDGDPVAVTGGNDRIVRSWNLRTRAPFGPALAGHDNFVQAVAAGWVGTRPVGVSGCSNRTIRIWDMQTGHQRGSALEGHAGAITALAVGEVHDRPTIASGGVDGTLRIWDTLWRTATAPLVVDIGSATQRITIAPSGVILVAGPAGIACLRPVARQNASNQ